MLCEQCGQREATCSVTVMMGGEFKTRHLCPVCMQGMQQGLPQEKLHQVINGILSALTSPGKAGNKPEKSCPKCGTTLTRYREQNALGCDRCYEIFRREIVGAMEQQYGDISYTGTPVNSDVLTPLQQLNAALEQAVATEDYETAALLRDRIREAEAAGEAEASETAEGDETPGTPEESDIGEAEEA